LNRSEAGRLGYEKAKTALVQLREEKARIAREAYDADPIYCGHCGQRLSYEQRRSKFCNQSCAAKHNNLGITRRPSPSRTRACICGAPKKLINKYCSACNTHNKKTSLDEAGSDATRRRILIDTLGRYCHICKNTEWLGDPITLELDHIDGNAENNAADNLRLLCPNCHSQTPTYKNKNRGKGRQLRRSRL